MRRLLALALSISLAAALEFTAEDVPGIATPASVREEGLVAIEGDFHAHTRFSDGIASPFDLVLLAERRGLRTIAVTEHNATFPAKLARAFASLQGSPVIVVVGEEVTSREAHVLALGIDDTVDPRGSIREIADEVHARGGVLIAAHPVRRFWPGLEGSCDVLDGVERMHPLAFRKPSSFGSVEEVQAFEDACNATRPQPLAVIGNSDFHVGPDLGEPRTVLFVRELTEAGVIDAIRQRRTVVRDVDGRWLGAEEWTRRASQLDVGAPGRERSTLDFAIGFCVIALFGFALLARRAAEPPRIT